tara:strand:+ start:277 stop:2211 length:1935 start_codon:yes stop_codon:yes gene_type:complete
MIRDEFNTTFSNGYTSKNIRKLFKSDYKKVEIKTELLDILVPIIHDSHEVSFTKYRDYDKFMLKMRKKYKYNILISKNIIFNHYIKLVEDNRVKPNYELEQFMRIKGARSRSGVVSVTVFTSGYNMGQDGETTDENIIKTGGCPMNCYYCPFEKDADGNPTQPRSYLSTEPGNKRATENKHHPIGQVLDRLRQLQNIGHISKNRMDLSKIELIISGGTFNFYPKKYIQWFSRCVYYACNTFYDAVNNWEDWGTMRVMKSLEEEQTINETTSIRIIGLTVETRPDYVLPKDENGAYDYSQLKLFREIGVTRVQIGFQSTKDSILQKINRQCTNEMNKFGLKILKQNGFKADIHIMFDLPGSSPEIDTEVVDEIVNDPDTQADQWKLYPTETTDFTVIKKWYDDGSYKPYAEDNTDGLACKLVDVLSHAMTIVPEYIRVNRVVRDIPHISIKGGLMRSNLRQLIKNKMDKAGIKCRDIREREVKHRNLDIKQVSLNNKIYLSSTGMEHFINYTTNNGDVLHGFIRLRLNNNFNGCLASLEGCALIRELHVYGQHKHIGNHSRLGSQHKGLGTKLIYYAEKIAKVNGFTKIAVISGTGVREYYKKKGYTVGKHGYMYKSLKNNYLFTDILAYCLIIVAIAIIIKYIS